MHRIGWIAATLALGGCATSGREVALQAAATSDPPIQSMTYATMPCQGSCPVYTVTVQADGAGVFTGIGNTAVGGKRRFTATPRQVAEFFHELQPYLPVGELLLTGLDDCEIYAAGLPSVDVEWTGGSTGHLLFDYGCDLDAHGLLAAALRTAPRALPIAGLIGQR